MKNITFEPTKPQLKIFSAILSNLTAGWIIVVFATTNPLTILINLIYAIITLYLAIRAENMIEK